MTETQGERRPDSVTPQESDAARKWLAKRGASVDSPRPLLAVRLGTQYRRTDWLKYYAIFIIPAIVGGIGYRMMLELLPNVRGAEITQGVGLYFVHCALQLTMWRVWSRADREVVARGVSDGLTRSRQPWWKLLGGWYLAATAVTFAGGAALGIAMVVTTSAWTYAWSWLGLLGIGALSTAVVLTSVLRAPVIADDEATRAVDELVRVERANGVLPAMFAIPVLFDVFIENREPAAFTGLLTAYAVLSVGLQVITAVHHRRRMLPPGDYGLPTAEPAGTT